MIIDAIINLAYKVINGIVNLFPTGTGFSSDVHTAFVGIGGYLGIASPLVPIATLATCVALVFSVEMSIFGFKTVKWVVSHLPYIGGKGN